MRLSTRSTYGLRAMLGLALEYGAGPVMLRDLAERQRLPVTYLEQLMVPLRKGGLLLATRGAKGGYQLARRPEEITVAEVVEALEGPLDLVECATIASCIQQPELCALRDLLQEASQAMINVLANVSLADLAARQCEKESVGELMYSI